jgi:hypothetical protein
VLGINPFDQPNVQESKDNTVRLLAEYAATGELPDPGGALTPGARDFPVRLLAHLKTIRPGDYVALTAYVQRTARREKMLRELRALIRDRYHVATTVGYGPRFLHSTGQLHKGGPGNGVFIQFTCQDPIDAPVHEAQYTFSVLKAAQALGDYQALGSRGRRALRVNLEDKVERGLLRTLAVVRGEAKTTKTRPARKPATKKTTKRAAAKKTSTRKSSRGTAARRRR